MLELEYIGKNLFECSVPLEGATKRYVFNGLEIKGKSAAEEITIETEKDPFVQLICIRDADLYEKEYTINIVARGEGKQKIVLCAHTIGDEKYITKEKIKIRVEEGADVEIIAMQNENGQSRHDSDYEIAIEKRGKLKLNIITLHGGRVNNKISSVLQGEGGECYLNGLYLGSREQVINTQVDLVHKVGMCNSSQLFKGILDDSAKSDFRGQVIVEREAQKTEAYQANNNLLLSDGAHATSKPELIIYADDVKCSHGATIGTLGDEELFYMRSRGISLKEAQLLQQQAFVAAVIEKIDLSELRERLMGLIERRLRGEMIHCAGCSRRCC